MCLLHYQLRRMQIIIIPCARQGIIDPTGTETRQNLSRMSETANFFKKNLFIPTYNGITASHNCCH